MLTSLRVSSGSSGCRVVAHMAPASTCRGGAKVQTKAKEKEKEKENEKEKEKLDLHTCQVHYTTPTSAPT